MKEHSIGKFGILCNQKAKANTEGSSHSSVNTLHSSLHTANPFQLQDNIE